MIRIFHISRINLSSGRTNVYNLAKTCEGINAEKDKLETFEENRSQLEQRVSVVEQGLTRSGVRTVLLGTEEVIELFYKIFNPGEAEKPIQTT